MGTSLRLVDYNSDGTIRDELVVRPSNTSSSDPIACQTFDLGFPSVREQTEDITDGDGTIDLTQYHGARTVSLDMQLLGEFKEYTEQRLRVFGYPGRRPFLYVKRDGWAQERRMLLRPSSFSFQSTKRAASIFDVSMSWVVPSGRMEGAELLKEELFPGTASAPKTTQTGGFQFPIKMPFSFTPGSGGGSSAYYTMFVENVGNAPVAPLINIYGAVSSPRLEFRSSGQVMDFNALTGLKLTETDVLAVDVAGKRVVSNPNNSTGTLESRYRFLNFATSEWALLYPGINEIAFSAKDLGAGAKIEFYYRPSWV